MRLRTIACVDLLLLCGILECSSLLEGLFVEDIGGFHDLSSLVPTEVLGELLQVMDDPTAHAPTNHPLADVAVGTAIDDLDQLAGCWTRYAHTVYEDYYSGDTVESDTYEMLEFDPESGLYTDYALSSPGFEPGWPEPPGSFLFITHTGPYKLIRDNAIHWKTGTVRGGASSG